MSHATEGELHAWLDGALPAIDPEGAGRLDAHLRRCADCRALLEEERSIRERAGELLGAALPAVEAPSYDAVVGAARPGGGRRSVERLAWAAGIVVALGAGWMGNALLRESPVLESRNQALRMEDRVAVEEPAAESRARELADADAATDPIGSGAEAEAAPATPESPRRAEAVAIAEADESADVLDVVAGEQAAAKTAELRLEAAAPDSGADDVTIAPTTFETAPLSEQMVADAAANAPEVVTDPVVLGAVRALAASIEWRRVDDAGATSWIGRPPLRVPSLEILAREAGTLDGAPVLRVTQRLADGRILEIFHEPAPPGEDAGGRFEDRRADEGGRRLAAAAAPPDAQERETASLPSDRASNVARDRAQGSLATIRNRVEGVWVTVVAPLAPESLAVLVSTIR